MSSGGKSSKQTLDLLPFDPNTKLQESLGFQVKGIDPYRRQPKNFSEEDVQTVRDLSALATELNNIEQLTRMFPTPEKIQEKMGCSLCKETAEPPAYMCQKSHLICGKHLKMVYCCPYKKNCNHEVTTAETCEMPFMTIRSLYYEYLYYHAKMECKNKKNGCKDLLMLGGEKTAHEQTCRFGKKNIKVLESGSSRPDQQKPAGAKPEVARKSFTDSMGKERSPAEAAKNVVKSEARIDESSQPDQQQPVGAKPEVVRNSVPDSMGKEQSPAEAAKNVVKSEARIDESSQLDLQQSAGVKPEVARSTVPDSKSKEQSPAEEAKNVVKLEARIDELLKSRIMEDDDNDKKNKKIAAKHELEFVAYRFTEEDFSFIVQNSGYLTKLMWDIPSVKELRIPKSILKREVRRFQIVLNISIEADRRRAQKQQK